ncbi:MAG: Unknown protein [uncultured Aureispira sp.]|uniref:Uncharacterized protein n=1 Tax=uncultured Aureispira sp. TaxID=1331704 RepID=A0A6S6U0N1_9BACT|nr:MAG: Unknown protein [uncultured Aureispira sp.]
MEIHDLLEAKAFEELNAVEQAFVLEQMSLEAYENARKAIVLSQSLFELESAQIQPKANASNKALLALRAKNKAAAPRQKTAWVAALFAYKIPAWQAVAALLLVFFFVRGLGVVQQDQTIIIANESLRDTVFMKEYITQIKELPADTVVKVVYRDSNKKEKAAQRVFASNHTGQPSKGNVNVKPKAVVQEFEDVLQYYNNAASAPASKDTFLQLMSDATYF